MAAPCRQATGNAAESQRRRKPCDCFLGGRDGGAAQRLQRQARANGAPAAPQSGGRTAASARARDESSIGLSGAAQESVRATPVPASSSVNAAVSNIPGAYARGSHRKRSSSTRRWRRCGSVIAAAMARPSSRSGRSATLPSAARGTARSRGSLDFVVVGRRGAGLALQPLASSARKSSTAAATPRGSVVAVNSNAPRSARRRPVRRNSRCRCGESACSR